MAQISIKGSALGAALMEILACDDIEPGSDVGYMAAKTIYTYHPIGGKLAEKPVTMAMAMPREITVQNSPGEAVKDRFLQQWADDGVDLAIRGTATLSRVYGLCSVVAVIDGVSSEEPLDMWKLSGAEMSFNVVDPLNTAGSMVLNQNPNSPMFLKHSGLAVAGRQYHRSRGVTLMNEQPVYLAYTNSAFGYVGRSVYQRALFPLKTFLQTMITDDMVSKKAGLLVSKLKESGSIVDGLMAAMAGVKRTLLKEAQTNNVISISTEEAIETLDMKNAEGPATMARRNCLENMAAANNMPAKMITEESLSSSLNEGTEEAKLIAQYVDGERLRMKPLYDFFDEIIMYRAWNEEFYAVMQKNFPSEYAGKDFKTAFYEWKNSFKAEWPSLIREPESEKAKTSKVKLDAMIQVVQTLLPTLDPENKALAIRWLADNMNEDDTLFPNRLDLDYEALAEYVPPQPSVVGSEDGADSEERDGARNDASGADDRPTLPTPLLKLIGQADHERS